MLFTLLAAAALQSAPPTDAADMPPPPPPGADGPPPPRAPRQQLFIAPSGAPFHGDPRGPSPKEAWFAQADANHDGRLDAQEFTSDFVAFDATLDSNHDGVIDAGEIAAYDASIPELHAQPFGGHHREGHPDGPPPGAGQFTPPPPGLARFALLPDADPVAAMDAAHAGRITRDDVAAAAQARFAALDTAHRGYLTLKDLPETWMEARRREMRARMEQGGWGGGHGGGWGHGNGGPGGDGGPGGPGGDMPGMPMPGGGDPGEGGQ